MWGRGGRSRVDSCYLEGLDAHTSISSAVKLSTVECIRSVGGAVRRGVAPVLVTHLPKCCVPRTLAPVCCFVCIVHRRTHTTHQTGFCRDRHHAGPGPGLQVHGPAPAGAAHHGPHAALRAAPRLPTATHAGLQSSGLQLPAHVSPSELLSGLPHGLLPHLAVPFALGRWSVYIKYFICPSFLLNACLGSTKSPANCLSNFLLGKHLRASGAPSAEGSCSGRREGRRGLQGKGLYRPASLTPSRAVTFKRCMLAA